MGRKVAHSEMTDRLCECGAKFGSHRDLRKHVNKKTVGDRTVWISTDHPMFPKGAPRKGRAA